VTPRRLDAAVVRRYLGDLRDVLARVAALGDVNGETLAADDLVRDALERRLIRLVDLAVALNTHVVASTTERAPVSYADPFGRAAEVGLISRETGAALAPSPGLRNLLVHEYGRVDLDRLAAAVPYAVADYGRYVGDVAIWLHDRDDDEAG
jgi:uncharacterized protein YutE (UPF0331/DUF86 family)